MHVRLLAVQHPELALPPRSTSSPSCSAGEPAFRAAPASRPSASRPRDGRVGPQRVVGSRREQAVVHEQRERLPLAVAVEPLRRPRPAAGSRRRRRQQPFGPLGPAQRGDEVLRERRAPGQRAAGGAGAAGAVQRGLRAAPSRSRSSASERDSRAAAPGPTPPRRRRRAPPATPGRAPLRPGGQRAAAAACALRIDWRELPLGLAGARPAGTARRRRRSPRRPRCDRRRSRCSRRGSGGRATSRRSRASRATARSVSGCSDDWPL